MASCFCWRILLLVLLFLVSGCLLTPTTEDDDGVTVEDEKESPSTQIQDRKLSEKGVRRVSTSGLSTSLYMLGLVTAMFLTTYYFDPPTQRFNLDQFPPAHGRAFNSSSGSDDDDGAESLLVTILRTIEAFELDRIPPIHDHNDLTSASEGKTKSRRTRKVPSAPSDNDSDLVTWGHILGRVIRTIGEHLLGESADPAAYGCEGMDYFSNEFKECMRKDHIT